MAVKRDYGSFSKACERYFTPMIAPLGMQPLGGNKFGRKRERWTDGLFLQQSQWGSGAFSVTIGIHIPELDDLWQMPPGFGFLVGGRLSERGVGSDCWLPARDNGELLASLKHFAQFLETAMPWFDTVQSIDDIAERYKTSNGIPAEPPDLPDLGKQLRWGNYGMLLLMCNRRKDARRWITAALDSMSRPLYFTPSRTFVYEKVAGAQRVKQSGDTRDQIKALTAVLAAEATE